MPQGMTAERLAEIRSEAVHNPDMVMAGTNGIDAYIMLRELLAEIDRKNAGLAEIEKQMIVLKREIECW